MKDQFDIGYDDAASGSEFDRNKPLDWKLGWAQYHADMQRSENVRFI